MNWRWCCQSVQTTQDCGQSLKGIATIEQWCKVHQKQNPRNNGICSNITYIYIYIHTNYCMFTYIHLNLTPGWHETSTAAKPSPRNNPSVTTKPLQWWRSWQVSICRRCCPPWHQGSQPNHGLIALVQLQPCLNLFTIPVHGGHVATYLILVSKKSESATVAQPEKLCYVHPQALHIRLGNIRCTAR